MALEAEELVAVERLVNDPGCRQWLNTRMLPDSKKNLRNYLFGFDDLDVAHAFDEIVEEAWRRIFQPGLIGAGAVEPRRKSGGADRIARKAFDESLISAPFRFIDLPDAVVPPEDDDPVTLDYPEPNRFCGTVRFQLIAETPLLIGAPTRARTENERDNPPVEPLRLGAKGPWIIPGATLRGMLRSACEIVGYGKLQRGNWHHRYGLRDFTHRDYRERSVSKVAEVHAGFLHVRDAAPGDDPSTVTDDGQVFELTKTRRDWAHVPITALREIDVDVVTPDETPNAGRNAYWINKPLKQKYAAVGMLDAERRPAFTRTYGFSGLKKLSNGGLEASPVKDGGEPGVLVFAGPFPGKGNKKVEYAFFPDPNAKPVALPRDRAELFIRINSKPSKNKTEPDGNWKELLPSARAGRIPVFYVGDPEQGGEDFFFGLTRLFKVPHRLTVGGVIAESQEQHIGCGKPERRGSDGKMVLSGYNDDFVERLFGYVIEPKDVVQDYDEESFDPASIAKKGRIACGFMRLEPDTPVRVENDPVVVVQMGPRASFAPLYLRSGEKAGYEKDYSRGDVKLAGRKAYFARYSKPDPSQALQSIRVEGEKQLAMIRESSRGRSDGRDTWSHLKFLMPAGEKLPVFSGEIRLHNVSAAEIGLVLYALTHGGDAKRRFRHMVGRAKPFGAGQMRVGAVALHLDPNDGKSERLGPPQTDEIYDDATGTGFTNSGGIGLTPFLEAFETYMRGHVPGFPNVPPVTEWLGMCDPANGEKAAESLHYQPLKSFAAVRDMFKPLPGNSERPKAVDRLLPAPRSKPAR